MTQLNLKELQIILNKFSQERDWDQFHSVKNLVMALGVETSELAEIFQWLTENQSLEVKNNPKLKGKAEDEVADVFIYLLRICTKLEIDLDQAVRSKIQKNALKYPVELSKGNCKKYSEL